MRSAKKFARIKNVLQRAKNTGDLDPAQYALAIKGLESIAAAKNQGDDKSLWIAVERFAKIFLAPPAQDD